MRHNLHALDVGVLPDGLEVLRWNVTGADVNVEVDVLPSSLKVLRLQLRSETRIAPGAIPAELKWLGLGLPAFFREREEELELRVPRSVNVLWMPYS
jgi:hypothetical protein